MNYDRLGYGSYMGDELDGQGTEITSNLLFSGTFKENVLNGQGTLINTSRGIKYQGEWLDNLLHGSGSITYSDGTTYQGEWIDNRPQFDPRHPIVKECNEKGVCTNTLLHKMPQRMGCDSWEYFCEYCWTHCQGQVMTNDEDFHWSTFGTECGCIIKDHVFL
jgi:hypothetical protein